MNHALGNVARVSPEIPLYDLEAERAVLGGILVDDVAAYPLAIAVLQPADFFRQAHQDIFAAFGSIVDRGSRVDFVTLKDELTRRGRLDDTGGLAYLSGLADGVPRATNVEYYARIVKEKVVARRNTADIQALMDRARSGDATAVSLADAVAQLAASAAERARALRRPGLIELAEDDLSDAVDVAAEGQAIAEGGVQYVIEGIVPAYGMLGFMVAFAKVGKTTFGHALGASVATGTPFLDRQVLQTRVLVIAAEDPREYTAYLARRLNVPRGRMTFYRNPVHFDDAGLRAIVATVTRGGYGLVIVSSWQAVTVGLVKDENDNAGAVAVVERTKLAARATGIPWLVDAHSGKGEDQADDADPTRAMRGASAAAGAADYMLSLRYAEGPFSHRRRLSGKGRFVSLEPMLLDYDMTTGVFSAISDGKSAAVETTWRLIQESGVLRDWSSADAIAIAIGLATAKGRVGGTARRKVHDALKSRSGVDKNTETRRGQQTTVYRESEPS